MRSETGERALGLLRSRDDWTAPSLAHELGVSVRTVHRLLAEFRERGLPIEASRGAGGGIRLGWSYGLDGLRLGHRDALQVLLALAVAERVGGPLMTARLPAVRQRLGLALPQQQRSAVSRLRRRVLVGASASPAVASKYGSIKPSIAVRIQEAFLAQRALRIAYRDGSGATSARKVEPHYLLFNPPCWYLLAWDSGKDAARHFRLDRLTDAGGAEEPFTLRPSKQLMPDVDTFFDGL